VLVQREIVGGFVWSAIPVRSLPDVDGRVVLFRAAGTTCYWPSHPKGERRNASLVVLRPEPWLREYAGMLTIAQLGANYSVTVLWKKDWAFHGWYVDFIRPYVRSPIGWDFADLHLDLIVSPDRAVRMKDEDDLAIAIERGEVSVTEARAIKQSAAALEQQAQTAQGIFGEPWADWRPHESWEIPSLRPGIAAMLSTQPMRADDNLDPAIWLTPQRT
jgi:predicted RNA-binding protein associated with RNAse of E/G family